MSGLGARSQKKDTKMRIRAFPVSHIFTSSFVYFEYNTVPHFISVT